ncbi:intraflagellar transport protein 57 homolog isoform X1 [Gadus macrocephalus]|uniref:intraflagellar transport protein 57 homolog isoform X1 n=1 Tax=Gadus macrocephalus TaxID=80720 RepID=UPI0028CB9EDE|nr:intraflagellar transport protein 57 homolog isoform X1 [Gadus macrocephalus]
MSEEPRRGEDEERGPGGVHHMFVVMEELLEKLKILDYEEEVLAAHNMKAMSRHYFVSSPYVASNPGEQFFLFTAIASWLINVAGRPFPAPRDDDEPYATVSNILAELRAFGVKVDFPPNKLKAGCGEQVCFVLDRLAEQALKKRGFSFKRPSYPTEAAEEEAVIEDDAELTLSKVEEEMIEEPDEEEEHVMDLDALKSRTNHSEVDPSSKPEAILEASVDAAEWALEVERVLPQLKVTIRPDNKDWRIHLDQMHQHRDGITASLKETKGYLNKLQEDLGKTLEKVNSREKYINTQLEHLIGDYRAAQAQLSQARELYQQASGGVTEKSRQLAEVSEELEEVKQEMEEKGSSMSDGAPVVKIKQSLTKLRQEVVQMDVRIGVVEHTLLQAKLREKNNMTRDMHATAPPEAGLQPYG